MTRTRPALHPLSLALLLALPALAWAQSATPAPPASETPLAPTPRQRPTAPPARNDAKKDADAPQQLDKVEVQGTASDDSQRRSSTASRIIIGRDEIDRYGDATVGELLKRLPGVTTGGRPGRGGEVRMRGMGAGFTQILVNGERMPPGFSLDELPPEQIERIEVMRAPTAEFGARAIAGTVNVVLREALQRRLNEVRTGLSLERDRLSPSFSWTRNDKLNDSGSAYNLTVNAQQHKNFDDVDQRSVTHNLLTGEDRVLQTLGSNSNERKSLNLTGRIQLRLDGGDTLAIQPFLMASRGGGFNQFRQTQTPEAPEDDRDHYDFNSGWTDSDNKARMARLNVQYNKRLSDASRVESRVGIGRMAMDSQSHREEFDDNVFHRAQDDVTKSRDTSWSFASKLTHQLENEHSLVAGIEGEGTSREQNRQCRERFDAAAPAERCQRLLDFGDTVDASTRRFAAFAQDEWSVGKQWSFYAGLRWEGIRTDSRALNYAVGNTSSVWTPLLHAVYKLDPQSREQIRASLTRSYRSPNLNDLTARPSINSQYGCDEDALCGENKVNFADRAGNPELRPEMATGIEIGWEKYPQKGGLLSANLFYRRITDLIRTQTQLEDVSWASVPRWVARPRNIGNARTYGIELEAKFRLDEYLDGALPVNMRSNLSLFHSAVEGVPGPHNKLDQQPRYTANLGADYRLRGLPLTLGASLNYTPANLLQQSDIVRTRTDPKRVIDVFATWAVSPTTQLRLSASNLAALDYDTGSVSTTAEEIITSRSHGRSFTVWQLRLEMKI